MPPYGANIPGGDFFDHVLGTSTDMLSSIVGSLPSFQDPSVPLPSYQDGYEVDPFLGLPSIATSITGAPARAAVAAEERTWMVVTPEHTEIVLGPNKPSPDAVESGFSATPVALTSALDTIMVGLAAVLIQYFG